MDEVNCYDGSTENAQTIPSIRSEEADTSNPTAITEQQQLVTALVPVPVPVLPPINDLPIVTLPADDVATATATVATAGILDDIQAQQKRKGVMHKYSLQNEKQWLDKLDELKKYHAEHGNCMVPQKYPLNPQLGTWVHKQRTQYAYWRRDKPSQITAARVKHLEDAGMDLSTVNMMQPKEEGWQMMYEKLHAFQLSSGHCLVPKRYKPDTQLGEWVCNQRKHYGFMKKGKKTAMTVERIKALEEIGFIWDASSKCANQRDEARWLFMLEQLKKYKSEKGDCLVPTKYAANPKLGNWVSNERRHYKLMLDRRPTSMTGERKRKLEDVGFAWLAPGSNYARHSIHTTNTNANANTKQDDESQLQSQSPPNGDIILPDQKRAKIMCADTVSAAAAAGGMDPLNGTDQQQQQHVATHTNVVHHHVNVNVTAVEAAHAQAQAMTDEEALALDEAVDTITMAAIVGPMLMKDDHHQVVQENNGMHHHHHHHESSSHMNEHHEPVAVSAMQGVVDGASNTNTAATRISTTTTTTTTDDHAVSVAAAVNAAAALQMSVHVPVSHHHHATNLADPNAAVDNDNEGEDAAHPVVAMIRDETFSVVHEETATETETAANDVSVEEVAARVAAAANAGKDGHPGAGGDDAPLSLWVCTMCGKTTFLKLAKCCEQNMTESVVQNI